MGSLGNIIFPPIFIAALLPPAVMKRHIVIVVTFKFIGSVTRNPLITYIERPGLKICKI